MASGFQPAGAVSGHAGFAGFYAALASALGWWVADGIERECRKGRGHTSPGGRALVHAGQPDGRGSGVVGLGGSAGAREAAFGSPWAWWPMPETALKTRGCRKNRPLLAYLIGVLCASDRLLAAALASGDGDGPAAALRGLLYEFSNHWPQPGEVRSGLILAALVLLVVPLVPNQPSCRGC